MSQNQKSEAFFGFLSFFLAGFHLGKPVFFFFWNKLKNNLSHHEISLKNVNFVPNFQKS